MRKYEFPNRDVERVFRAAERFARKRGWTEFAPVRRLARSLNMRQSLIIQCVEDGEGWGLPMDLAVGVQVGGGSGYATFDTEGDYEVEVWEDEV